MVTKSRAHAHQSPIPGLVVIVLAIAAVLFGIAFVAPPAERAPAQAEESPTDLDGVRHAAAPPTRPELGLAPNSGARRGP